MRLLLTSPLDRLARQAGTSPEVAARVLTLHAVSLPPERGAAGLAAAIVARPYMIELTATEIN